MGLIQREIERAGIVTIGLSIVRRFTENVKPPRTLFLDWPFGHPLGRPGNVPQQRAVLLEAFKALYGIGTPGVIVHIPFAWEKQNYDDYDFSEELRNLGVAQPWGGQDEQSDRFRSEGEQGPGVEVRSHRNVL